jgi:hypothetical protein
MVYSQLKIDDKVLDLELSRLSIDGLAESQYVSVEEGKSSSNQMRNLIFYPCSQVEEF